MASAAEHGHHGTPPPETLLTPEQVAEHVTRKTVTLDPKLVAGMLGLLILLGLGIVGFLVRALGDGFGGDNREAWGYYVAMFAFLLATVGSAPVVAVAFRWTKNHWRRPLSRASELFAVVGVLNVLWFIPMIFLMSPIDLNGDGALAVGQDRRTIWFETPIGAPLVWDTLAVVGLAVAGLAVLYVSARPDFAALAHRSDGVRKGLWAKLALGWQGTEREWVVQKGLLAIMGGLYFMMLIFVHTLISLDYALSYVPGWKDSIFAPYHALTGLQAGGGVVIVTLFIMKRWGGYKDYIGVDPFWSFSKILLGLTLLWGYFWFSEFMTFWYGRDPTEQAVMKLIMFESYRTMFILNFFFSFIIPFSLLLWNSVRKSVLGPSIAAASVIIGAFFMMIRIYVPAWNIPESKLGAESIADFEKHGAQTAAELLPVLPDLWDIFIILGGLGAAGLFYLLATRIVPILSLWEFKEGMLYILWRPLIKGKYMVLGKPE